jgi:hypothetical protein
LAWKQIEQLVPPLVDELSRAGIRVAALKGLAYAPSIYARAAERPMSDVDLLVERAKRDTAHTILERSGFARAGGALGHHATVWTKGKFVVDLHHDLIGVGRAHIDHAALWDRMRPGWPSGAWWLDPVDTYAFHLVHMVRNRLRGPLLHVLDAAWLVQELPNRDPEPSLERAADWGLARGTQLAHRFAEGLQRGVPITNRLVPTLHDLAVFEHQATWQKLAFDVVAAGSLSQLGARFVAYASNRWAKIQETG